MKSKKVKSNEYFFGCCICVQSFQDATLGATCKLSYSYPEAVLVKENLFCSISLLRYKINRFDECQQLVVSLKTLMMVNFLNFTLSLRYIISTCASCQHQNSQLQKNASSQTHSLSSGNLMDEPKQEDSNIEHPILQQLY